MKRTLTGLFLLTSFTLAVAQVTISPVLPTVTQSVTITYDAAQGNAKLLGAAKVYMHAGVVITKPGDTQWSYAKGNWGLDDGVGQMTSLGNNKWSITIVPQTYFAIPATENAFRLAMVFRNADGSLKGQATGDQDIFVNINPGYYSLLTSPATATSFVKVNTSTTISATASASSTMNVYINNVVVKTVTNATSISHNATFASAGKQDIKVTSSNGSETETKLATIYSTNNSTVQARPAGVKDGINYTSSTSVTLSLYAPGKDFVYVIGDFNSWGISPSFQMKKTPDGQRFWIQLTGLVSGKEYIFQYYVDGKVQIADPYADKIADPWNDKYIPATTYPGLIAYTNEANGIASTFQTSQTQYNWQVKNFQGVPKNKLMIYELLIRDFTSAHSYQSVIDSMQYLKKLGINAIELMPVNEFEGNDSWGYNPSFYFAPDKYYGTKNKLKELVDLAHANGMSVIIDMVLNHSFGQSPMVRMYWDEANGRPSSDSPWFNTVAPNSCYQWGYDFNHEKAATQRFVDSVNSYWITEYKMDGIRFDFTKGFSNTSVGSPDCGFSYDQSRINNINRMADKIRQANPNAYVILEHLTDDAEENALAGNGLLPWRHVKDDYKEVISGWQLGAKSFAAAQNDNRVIYMESHDEERIMLQNLLYGNIEGTYNIKDTTTALDRMEIGAAFLYTVPGPKMLWMFGEHGYDYSIDYNGRTGAKPLVWKKYMSQARRRETKNTFAALLNLRKNYPVFTDGFFTWGQAVGETRWIKITHASMNVMIIGNFAAHTNTVTPAFPNNGTWYNYFKGNEFNYNGGAITLAPGEWMLLTSVKLPMPACFAPSAVVTTNPVDFTADTQVKITFDASQASGNLTNAAKVYMHSGVVLSSRTGTTWGNTIGTWGADNGVGQMTKVAGTTKWEITITPRTYYGVAAGTIIYRLAMVFRDANGANTGKGPGGSDIFIDIPPVAAPTSLTATAATKQVNLTWNDNMQLETSYVVERSTTSGSGFAVIATLPANTTTYSDVSSTLQNATYYYRVKGTVNATVSSTYSNQASVAFVSSFTVYLYKPAAWSNAVNVHYWNYVPAGALPQSNWPGPAMTVAPAQGANWYKYTFTGVNSTSLLFDNNGGAQTADLTRNKDGWYKDGVWYDQKPDISNGLTIHFKKPAAWVNANMHYWNIKPEGAAANSTWPGAVMTNIGNGWYAYTIPNATCANIVFSDNGNTKTADLIHCGESWYDNGWLPSNPGGRSIVHNELKPEEESAEEPKSILGQNYPNPFNEATTIPFTVPETQFVRLHILDLQGKEIKTLINEVVEKGDHEVNFSTENLQPGTFFYQLRLEKGVAQKRMIVKK
jgi:1,4-alpha-glucan branching enzyme